MQRGFSSLFELSSVSFGRQTLGETELFLLPATQGCRPRKTVSRGFEKFSLVWLYVFKPFSSITCDIICVEMPRKLKHVLPPIDTADEPMGQRIARLRKQQGLIQTQLGKKIGIPQTLVSEYETGRVKMSAEMVARFAIALEATTDEILGLKSISEGSSQPSLKIVRRLHRIQSLPEHQQKVPLKTLDMFLKAAGT